MTGLSRPSPGTFTMVIYGRLIELSRRSVGAEYFLPLVRRPTKFPSGLAVPSYSAALQGSHNLFGGGHKRRTKKHLARTDSKFDFSSRVALFFQLRIEKILPCNKAGALYFPTPADLADIEV